MCGIAGLMNLDPSGEIEADSLRRMLGMIRHRGPDGFGIYVNDDAGLGSARLSIIDLSTGDQPICNEDESLWIVFNGEIFNHVELRPRLEARGHRFSTRSDTEVILHLFEDKGPACLEELNGQFALAIWDARQRRLFLARDRLGVRPLFYTLHRGQLLFASEMKCLLAYPGVQAAIDPLSLDQVFTYWSVQPPRTIFRNIFELPPGHYLTTGTDSPTQPAIQPYWTLDFSTTESRSRPLPETLEAFEDLLVDAVRIRLRADVPVGAYLSGGLDSSTIAAIIRNHTNASLDTFSIAFSNPDFDESRYQQRMADYLGTAHQVVYIQETDIGRAFPGVVWHAETPLLRTAPAPMYALSQRVREQKYKVVLTGEGADEFLAGYDIFKEARIRRFWARQPESELRPLLLKRLYPDIAPLAKNTSYLRMFFGAGLSDTGSPVYSHAIRWKNTARARRFFSPDLQTTLTQNSFSPDKLTFPPGFESWDPLAQAQYLEVTTFLSPYLLSSQGDRMAMAHSVEGRYPFLDFRLVEFCSRLPSHLKLNGLTEKFLLRKLSQKWLPAEILQRVKRPYRAPVSACFFHSAQPEYVAELLSPDWLRQAGLFASAAVQSLVQKAFIGKPLGQTDDMALAGILSTQLVYQQFVQSFQPQPPVAPTELTRAYFRQHRPAPLNLAAS